MPEIPGYGGPRVEERALPAARISTDAPLEAFGGGAAVDGISRATRGVAEIVSEIGIKEREKANQLAVLDADRRGSELETNVLYAPVTKSDGTPNPKPGALNVSGKAAFALPDTVMQEFDKESAKIEDGLSNAAQKNAFRRLSQTRRGEIDRQLQRHVSQQIKKFDDDTVEAYLNNERDAAAFNFGDPERISLAIQLQRGAIADYAGRQGLPADWVKAKGRDAESKTHLGVIDRMIATENYDGARAYYDANHEGVAGLDAAGVERAIKATEHARQGDLFLQATNIVDKQPGVKPREIIPQWERLSLEQRRALESRSEEVDNDDQKWLALREMSAEQLAAIDPVKFNTEYYPRFDKAHRERALDYWAAARDGKRAGAEFKSIRSDHEMVLDALRTVKLIATSGPVKDEEATSARAFEDNVDDAFKVYFHQNGKNPNDEQKQKIIHGLLLKKVSVDRNWFSADPPEPVAALSAEDLQKAYVPIDQIPASDRQALVQLARSQGRVRPEVNDERAAVLLKKRIERAYAAAVAGGKRSQLISIINEE